MCYIYDFIGKFFTAIRIYEYIQRIPLFHDITLQKWQMFHTSDLMMMIRYSTYILTITIREMGNLKTHSPIYCMKDNWENWRNLRHTLDNVHLTSILEVQYLQIRLHNNDNEVALSANKRIRLSEHNVFVFFAHILKLHSNKRNKTSFPGIYMRPTTYGGTTIPGTQPWQKMWQQSLTLWLW